MLRHPQIIWDKGRKMMMMIVFPYGGLLFFCRRKSSNVFPRPSVGQRVCRLLLAKTIPSCPMEAEMSVIIRNAFAILMVIVWKKEFINYDLCIHTACIFSAQG